MSPDPLVMEVRAIREAFAKQFNYDLETISRHLKEQEKKSEHKTVSLASKRVGPAEEIANPQK